MNHSFQESLKMSHDASDLPLWETCYRKAFPTFSEMIDHRKDGWHQRAGIDRSIILECSRQILVDEKIRGRNKKTGKVYGDIAVEHWSDYDRKTPGWATKSIRADYIAYAIAPLGRCYMLPVIQLQSAWKKNYREWIVKFEERFALNRGYRTAFCPIPVPVLFKAIGQQLRLEFEPVEWNEPA